MKSLALIISFVLFVTQTCKSQGSLPPGTYTSTNKKAIKFLEEAKKIMKYVKMKKQRKTLTKL